MQTTIDSSRGIDPFSISLIAHASVVPPAGSVKMPSVWAISWTASRISLSVAIAPDPPLARTALSTWNPSAGLPIAIERAIVFGFTGSGNSRSSFERVDDRRAAGRLRGMDRRQIAFDEPDFAKLAEPARDARQQRAAGHRRHDVPRKLPPELFGDFEAVGLRAFGVIAAQIDVRESPAVLLRNLRAQPVHIVVVALDGDDLRVVDRPSRESCSPPDRAG